MKTWISIALNIILVGVVIAMYVGRQVSGHYYKEFTGFVLSSAARQIQAGNSKLVSDILNEVHGRPTYGDLISIYEKLNAKTSAEQEGASNGE
jgi:hypothetical protein